jgi:hypothetical protein
MILAAATQLCRTFAFPLRDQNPQDEQTVPVLTPRPILGDWSNDDVNSLFSCAMFDEAAYGRVRFHHRNVAEYLAALWLSKQIEKGCPRKTILGLLFRESHGQVVLIPSLAPVAAWLSANHPFVRRKIIEASPETLITDGDPTQLPTEDRKTLVRRLAKQTRVSLGFGIFPQLRRLAIPDLAPLINSLLIDETVTRDAKLSLLLIASEGRLEGCAETILSIAVDSAAHQTLIQYAAHALGSIASATHLRRLCDAMLSREVLSPGTTAELGRACYPSILTEQELRTLIEKTDFPIQNHASTFAINLGQTIEEGLPIGRLASLIETLTAIIQLPPVIPERQFGQFEDVSENYKWLFEPLAKAVALALLEENRRTVDLAVMTKAIRTLESVRATDHYYNSYSDLAQPLRISGTNLRRSLFWAEVASQRDGGNGETNIHVPSYYDLWKIEPEDMLWLLDDAATKGTENDRMLAYRTAIIKYHELGRLPEIKKRLKSLAGQSTIARILSGKSVGELLDLRVTALRHFGSFGRPQFESITLIRLRVRSKSQ